jgi:hypothetical protein
LKAQHPLEHFVQSKALSLNELTKASLMASIPQRPKSLKKRQMSTVARSASLDFGLHHYKAVDSDRFRADRPWF